MSQLHRQRDRCQAGNVRCPIDLVLAHFKHDRPLDVVRIATARRRGDSRLVSANAIPP